MGMGESNFFIYYNRLGAFSKLATSSTREVGPLAGASCVIRGGGMEGSQRSNAPEGVQSPRGAILRRTARAVRCLSGIRKESVPQEGDFCLSPALCGARHSAGLGNPSRGHSCPLATRTCVHPL